jgi:hypothetical protein
MTWTFLRPVALFLTLSVSLAASWPAQAKWLKAESALFTVYSEGKESELRDFTEKLYEFDSVLRRMTGLKAPHAPNKFTIYLMHQRGQLKDVAPRVSSAAAGFYRSSFQASVATAIRTPITGITPEIILFHEYVHHFVRQYFPAAYPVWFTEGFAEYFSTATFEGARVVMGAAMPGRAYQLINQTPRHVSKILAPASTGDIDSLFNAQSWLIVHYMMTDAERRAKMFKYLQAIGRGEDVEKSWVATFGGGFEDFHGVIKGYLAKGKLVGMALPRRKEAVEVSISVLSPAADDLLLDHARLLFADPAEEPAFLASVRRKAERHEGDILAIQTLAMAEIFHGALDKADTALQKLDAAAPDAANTAYLRALRHIIAGRRTPEQRADQWRAARAPAALAFKRDPNHYAALYLYTLSVMEDGAVPNENTVNALLLAHQLAPQSDDIRLEAAAALYRAGRTAEAMALLRALAYATHAGAHSKAAHQMLNEMETGTTVAQPFGSVQDEDD